MSPLTSASQNAEKFNDAYFTSENDVKWSMDHLASLYDLKGKTALEPAVGSGVFPMFSESHGLAWTTNELFPENSRGFNADYNIDFAKGDISPLGKYDFVITNPPFGKSSNLAKKFIMRSLEISDVVAMVLPKGCRSPKFQDSKLPKDIKIVFDKDLPDSTFLLPDGTVREVGCAFIVYERVKGYERPLLLEYAPEGYSVTSGAHDWPKGATHATCLWGSASGKIVTQDSRPKCWAKTAFLTLSPEQSAAIPDLALRNVSLSRKTSVLGLSIEDIYTTLNPIFRSMY